MSKKDLYIFRHGETDWNKEQRFQGHTDIPLNENGRQQAADLAKILKSHDLEVIVSSDLSRALETASIVNASKSLPLHQTPDLRECNLGDIEGLHREVILTQYKTEWERWISNNPADEHFKFPNGESKTDHLQRMVRWIENFCKANMHLKSIAVSTHGASVRRLVHHCKDAPVEPVKMPNCVLYKVSIDLSSGDWFYHGLIE
ncbi:2,3-bisphosphoglycerate-dependent phosphoglycerate mutase [compost metagenome]